MGDLNDRRSERNKHDRLKYFIRLAGGTENLKAIWVDGDPEEMPECRICYEPFIITNPFAYRVMWPNTGEWLYWHCDHELDQEWL